MALGADNTCGSQGTSLTNLTTADADFVNGKTGVWGATPAVDGFGVRGHAQGQSNTGVRGETTGHHTQIAMDADVTNGAGEGIGLRARTKNGIAVHASATGGYALQCDGRTVFSRSGKVTFQAGQTTRSVTRTGAPNSLSAAAIIVATIQGSVVGTWVTGCVRNSATTFTIRLNKPAPAQLKVGWFIVN
jgi:hypothetical protein